MEYSLTYSAFTGRVDSIRRLKDNACIPLCEDNTDYQEFLEWNKEQKEPLDLKSTIEPVKPEPVRDYLAEIDYLTNQITSLKEQITINTDNINAIAEKTKVVIKPLPIEKVT